MLLHKTSLDARRAESSGAAATFTFPGLPINAIDGGPPRKELPWRKCVNTAWINRQPHGQCWREDDIQLVPILAIDIPDSMFNDEDLLWLEVMSTLLSGMDFMSLISRELVQGLTTQGSDFHDSSRIFTLKEVISLPIPRLHC